MNSLFPNLGFGLGLRTVHYPEILQGRSAVSPSVQWFEIITENFMGKGGRPLFVLEQVRRDFGLAFHGVSLSLGSVDPLNLNYLKRLREMIQRYEPSLISDHLCWTGMGGENLHDLLPLPFTEEAITHVVDRIVRVQDILGRRILIENASTYLSFAGSEMSEQEFLVEIVRRADCGVLLDFNNVYVSSINHGFDPVDYLRALPRERVGQIHLAGHSTRELANGQKFLIDTHDHPVCPEVWSLYRHSVRLFGGVSTMVEWDANIPEFTRLVSELDRAREIFNGETVRQRNLNGVQHEL